MSDLKLTFYSQQRESISFSERYVCYECGQKNFDSARILCSRSRRLRRNLYLIQTKSHSLKRRDKRLKDIHEKLRQDLRKLQSISTTPNHGNRRKVSMDADGRIINADDVTVEAKTGRDTITDIGGHIEIITEENAEVPFELATGIRDGRDNKIESRVSSKPESGLSSDAAYTVSKEDEAYVKHKHDIVVKNVLSVSDNCVSSSMETDSKRTPAFPVSPLRKKYCNRYKKRPESRSSTLKRTSKNISTKTSNALTHGQVEGRFKQSVCNTGCYSESSFHRFSPCRVSIRRHKRNESRQTTLHENSLLSGLKSPSKKSTNVMRLARSVFRVISAKAWPRKLNSHCADFVCDNSQFERGAN